MADKKLSSVSAVTDMNYVYAETSSGETVKISKADLATVVAEHQKFYSGKIYGTQPVTNAIEVAKEVINSIPFNECTFCVLYSYQGIRTIRGYVYGSKGWGLIIIEEFSGNTVKVSLMSGEYAVVE